MSNFVLTPNAVAKLRRAIAPRSGNTGAIAATGVPIDLDKFPPPFTVRWSASAASGAGAWVIWLPDVAQLVMLKDAYITPTGVTAEQALPAGWYTIDDATASSTEVYLNVTIPETGTASAEISTVQGQSTTDETVMSILVAEMETDAETGAKRVKQYVDSAALVGSVKDGESGADAGISIAQEPIAPSTDHPGGGIQITFQPLQDGQPHGQPTVVTLWNGSGGGGGGTDLSDTPALDVVPSTGQASAGVAVTASRQDHVHKMPATVVLTDADQTINSVKTIMPKAGSAISRLNFQHTASGGLLRIQFNAYSDQDVALIYFNALGSNLGNIIMAQGTFLELGARTTGTGAVNDVRLGSGADLALAAIAPTTSNPDARRIVDVKWVTTYFQQKLTEGSNITISGNTISAVIPGSLPNPYSLRVYGNPTSSAGTAIANPDPTTYDGSAQKDIHLDGLVTKGTDQFINSVKVIGPKAGSTNARIDFQHTADGGRVRLQYGTYDEQDVFQMFLAGIGSSSGNIIMMQGTFLELGARATDTGAIDDVRLGTGADTSLANIAPTTSGADSRRITDVKWVTNRFQQKLTPGNNIAIVGNTISAIQPTVNDGTLTIKQGATTLGTFTANQLGSTTVTIPEPPTPPSGTVEFVADIDWYVNGSTHQIRKRLRVLNLATGAITDKAGTTYANGWEVAANTTPISSIIPPSS